MFTLRTLAVSCAACLFAVSAAAQTQVPVTGPDPRFLFSLNGLGETGSQDFSTTVPVNLYDEAGQYEITQGIGSGAAFDIGLGYRLGRHLGVGLGFTTSSSRGTATVTGSVPHPLFFDRPRAFTVEMSGLRQREQAVHFQATWFVPVTTTWDVILFAGPSIVHVSQDQISDVQVIEVGPPFTSVVGNIPSRVARKGSGAGFNIGVDTTYTLLRDFHFLRGIGAGLTLRYAGGSVDIDEFGGGQRSVDVGGFQIGGGLRVRF